MKQEEKSNAEAQEKRRKEIEPPGNQKESS